MSRCQTDSRTVELVVRKHIGDCIVLEIVIWRGLLNARYRFRIQTSPPRRHYREIRG